VVAWDVAVTKQNEELVASYDILTLVAKRAVNGRRQLAEGGDVVGEECVEGAWRAVQDALNVAGNG
jgi:hypothetical protein